MDARPDDLVIHQSDVQAVVNAVWAAASDGVADHGPAPDRDQRRPVRRQHLLLQGRTYSPPFVVTDGGDDERRRVGAALQQEGVADAPDGAGRGQALVHDRHPVGRRRPDGVHDGLDVGLVDHQVVGACVHRAGCRPGGRGRRRG